MSSTTLYQSVEAVNSYFRPGPTWSSFERFRLSGPKGLGSINSGKVGCLRVGESSYRILEESDFQRLLGLATEVDRLKKGLNLVLCAARVLEMHRDEPSLETLKAAVAMIIKVPELPTRSDFGCIEPEGLFTGIDEAEDEVELDNITRPLTNI